MNRCSALKKEFDDDIIVSYADIIYDKKLLEGLVKSKYDIAVTVDVNWKEYWSLRYGNCYEDTESLSFNNNGTIKELGRSNPDIKKIDGRYVGLIKFSCNGIMTFKDIYYCYKSEYWDKPWQVSGKPFRQAYMTDMIQAIIDSGISVYPYIANGGWLEFDTNEDYEKMIRMFECGELVKIIDLNK